MGEKAGRKVGGVAGGTQFYGLIQDAKEHLQGRNEEGHMGSVKFYGGSWSLKF